MQAERASRVNDGHQLEACTRSVTGSGPLVFDFIPSLSYWTLFDTPHSPNR